MAAGNYDLFKPLSYTLRGNKIDTIIELPSKSVTSINSLEEAIQKSTQPVVLDFYADWCVACKELELNTFSNPGVKKAMSDFNKIKVDVTEINAETKLLLKKYGLYGPPAIIHVGSDSEIVNGKKLVGYVEPEKLTRFLQSTQR